MCPYENLNKCNELGARAGYTLQSFLCSSFDTMLLKSITQESNKKGFSLLSLAQKTTGKVLPKAPLKRLELK